MDYSKVNIFYPVIGYTGMVQSDYMMRTIDLMSVCRQKNIKIGLRSIWFESLISRARNASVAFMLNKDYTHSYPLASSWLHMRLIFVWCVFNFDCSWFCHFSSFRVFLKTGLARGHPHLKPGGGAAAQGPARPGRRGRPGLRAQGLGSGPSRVMRPHLFAFQWRKKRYFLGVLILAIL